MNKSRSHQYPLAKTVDRNLKMLQSICHQPDLKQLSASQLMGERSYLTGATFNNRMSPGKSCRLIDCKEDTIAVNLPREDDWGLTAAWLGGPELKFGDWDGINSILRRKTVHDLLLQAQLLGIAAACQCILRYRQDVQASAHGRGLSTVGVAAYEPAPGSDKGQRRSGLRVREVARRVYIVHL